MSTHTNDPAPVAVIGAGSMGSGIAQVAAQAGHEVHLVDVREGAAAAAVEKLQATLARLVSKGKFTAEDATAIGQRLVVGPAAEGDLAALPPMSLVVEAAVERLDVKQQIFATLAEHQPAETILATNTSSLDITQIAADVPHPGRVVGLHFFNPAAIMRLVEVVRGEASDPLVLERAAELMRTWGKTPVHCTSTPGFIVNRVARPFYGEAQRMVGPGGHAPADLDRALTEYAGFTMGPFRLTDLIGQDVNYAVGESVWEQTDRDPRYEPTAFQKALVDAGTLGRKTGRGVYTYDADGRPQDAEGDEFTARALAHGPVELNVMERTLSMLVNEAVDLVHRGEATREDVDTAMRLGTNYPKGPFEWLEELGAAHVLENLRLLDAAHPGGRYRPSDALVAMAEQDDTPLPAVSGSTTAEPTAAQPAPTGSTAPAQEPTTPTQEDPA
ncbi:3-hydroxybutyryl-CoA dehydrogenase [Kytococcus aerolatus]|uniref:3-hydroxybutyryl-CoA dehydrogenase n=1 Tax=Kytococcus aerolatus TaxID=592308 RepID=A0A212TEP8_9MICO|nr:3-hydroxyacyl-CoA dehydrogenase NAD-binding domain-containing protein [Kytococcus aerolatus]SNC64502.1 3-hydroxybutyryl-CoA dehydrogenase [Kytococcus aerolatus]